MKKNILAVALFSILLPFLSFAQDEDFESTGMESSPIEEVSAPAEATPTESATEVVPESMEEATFDDVSYE